MPKSIYIAGAIVAFVVIAVTVGFLVSTLSSDAQVGGTLPANTARHSDSVSVGPQEDIQVSASSSGRTYLALQYDTTSVGVDVWCNADQDNAATVGEGVLIASTTDDGGKHVWSFATGNPYQGGVRCTASATTTILRTEYLVR